MSVSNAMPARSYIITKRKDWLVVLLFSILPLIDTLNGFFEGLPIGILYKAGLCGYLFMSGVFSHRFIKRYVKYIILSIGYILLSVAVNMAMGGKLINSDFPVKLMFNIVLLCLLMNAVRIGKVTGDTFYWILDNSSWIFIMCFLIPYILGVGKRVYGGDMGYKAFFISQNELGLVIVVMTFFAAYKLISRINAGNIACLALLFLCGMLLNTKTTIVSCAIAVALWIVPVIMRSKMKVKIAALAVIIIGVVVFRNKIISTVEATVNRYSVLVSKSYEGSSVAGILSGRNYYLQNAWENLKSTHTAIRIFLGNGFCSDTLIEMDLFDIFFYLGTVGVGAGLVFLFRVFRKSLKKVKQDHSIIRPASFLVIAALMTLAGHVLFMSMSGCYFVLYVCFLLYYEKDKSFFRSIINRSDYRG